MERLRKSRRPVRTQLTKLIKDYDADIAKENPDKNALLLKNDFLQMVFTNLEDCDAKIRKQMTDDDVPQEDEDKELLTITSAVQILKKHVTSSLANEVPLQVKPAHAVQQVSKDDGKTSGFGFSKVQRRSDKVARMVVVVYTQRRRSGRFRKM